MHTNRHEKSFIIHSHHNATSSREKQSTKFEMKLLAAKRMQTQTRVIPGYSSSKFLALAQNGKGENLYQQVVGKLE
ncbi:hypothetical protein BofuT4_uP108480.1 [Botrytis cinerea T4]|uniref:Uncharacterized protein n=1 Tax=Botryotinia fuckeliana (strain T4) TaxID=999810 RepID=G2Y762_BOTF4|nr:hypothetical protein BofuT4_uP108480.1 [Botrytis cinerea T4]